MSEWKATKELRFKKQTVSRLSSSINAPRMDRKLQQKWICGEEWEWRDVPLVEMEAQDKM